MASFSTSNYFKQASEIVRTWLINEQEWIDRLDEKQYIGCSQFFEEYNKQKRNNLRTKYYEMMTDLQTHFSFFDFLDYHIKKISVIEKIFSWTTTENHEKVYQTYPPFKSIILNQNSGVQELTTPIKRPSLSDDNKNLDSIIQQNNHTNTYLKIIGQKLQDLEDKLTPSSTSIKKENASNIPLFIRHEIPPHLRAPFKKPMTEKTDNLLNEKKKKTRLNETRIIKGHKAIKKQEYCNAKNNRMN